MTYDLNRSALSMPAEVSNDILAAAVESSAVMQLARRIDLPGTGAQVNTILGEPTAAWVGETDLKPVSNSNINKKVMTAYKVAVIETVSKELARDARGLYEELRRRLPYSIGAAFDKTVFGAVNAPGANFDQLSDADAVTLGEGENIYNALVKAYGAVAENGYTMNGAILAPAGAAAIIGAKDDNNRPYDRGWLEGNFGSKFVNTTHAMANGIIGFAGDWNQALYGVVNGIELEISTEATLTVGSGDDTEMISMFQNNMIAIKCEAELGFVANTDAFAKLPTLS